MTTQPSEIQPRDPAGKFGRKHLSEVPPLDLNAPAAVPADEPLPWQLRFNAGRETVEQMVARRVEGGGFTEVERQDDVEARLREQFSAVDQDSFDAGFSRISAATEQVSVLECADAYDTEAYEDLMNAASIEPLLVAEWDREPGDALEDWAATHRSVIEHYDDRVFAATYSLWEADEAARNA